MSDVVWVRFRCKLATSHDGYEANWNGQKQMDRQDHVSSQADALTLKVSIV